MPALHEQQSRFYAAMMHGADAALLETLVETGARAQQGIAAYRRSITGNLVGALQATYPVLERIVGTAFFRAAALDYVHHYPSEAGDLNGYGEQFADFIATWPAASSLAYLPGVAQLEWLVQTVYYAADAGTDLSALARCEPARYGELRFAANPALARLDSPWPLDRIWQVNAEGYDGDMAVDFTQGCSLAVARRAGRVYVEALSPGVTTFVDTLVSGQTLAQACDKALAAEPGLDPSQLLASAVTQGYLLRALAPLDEQVSA